MLTIRNGLGVLALLLSFSLSAQNRLEVLGVAPQLHLKHTVVPKENWYSVGRLYNLSPKELAAYNKTTIDKPLVIAQELQIPLTASNFTQNGQKANDEVFVPVYHQVQEKEWMYRIGVNYKVKPEDVEKWNGIKTSQLKAGMFLVVGYLRVKTGQSALASSGSNKITPVKPETGTAPVVAKETKPVPDPKAPVPPAKEEPVKTEVKSEPVKPEPPKPEPVKAEEKPLVVNPTPGEPANHKGGVFRRNYEDGSNLVSGNAGIFRSTSGWNDGKYYALMNNVPVGTIVKVTFSSTNKSIYAKVLGQLPEMKESAGLSLRISDAAASELGVSNAKFYVDVKY